MRGSDDFDRGADFHHPPQARDVAVAHADTAVGGTAGYQLRFVGPVNTDHAAPGPLAEARGVGAGAEREGTVNRAADREQLLGDEEVSGGGGQARTPDADRCAEGHPPVAVEADALALAVHP